MVEWRYNKQGISSSTTEVALNTLTKENDMMNRDPYLNDYENAIEDVRRKENEPFQLTAPDGYVGAEESLGDLDTNDSIVIEIEDSRDLYEEIADNELYEDDGQPTEYEEWQDVYGGDDWDHGQYDE